MIIAAQINSHFDRIVWLSCDNIKIYYEISAFRFLTLNTIDPL